MQSKFARTLRAVRVLRGLSQEQFDTVSSRTYLSAMERGLKIPTLGKIEELASVMNVHPATLIALSYCDELNEAAFRDLWERVALEGAELLAAREAQR
ncbi:helix-turn-helix domain-containing protein [Caldimonas brevitalea]|uniref:Transcriptional regulator, PbsX family n=1 Tax=Caldimonas brevitalea TaxID=413882 RepID=A0A0G3BBX2_9BURK|nr:helix-turn-helix transcriptional regulator [Caldimonas brevitalea]AKJ26849.1 transcriptional regulator, PbsX family [Caldimonas brevitalea]